MRRERTRFPNVPPAFRALRWPKPESFKAAKAKSRVARDESHRITLHRKQHTVKTPQADAILRITKCRPNNCDKSPCVKSAVREKALRWKWRWPKLEKSRDFENRKMTADA